MLVAERPPAEMAAIRLRAERELVRQSFPDMLERVSIRSDDPLDPTIS